MWLRKWESPRTLAMIRVVSVRRERLDAIDADDVVREGLPEATTPEAFVQRFCRAMKCRPDDLVTRIEFEYLPEGEQ
ncbi:MAG: hypothetical protein GC161_18280 [Planctomycetaceae bacterium]|nr:hypothetical protein [Planctomycetaceae bacterium]